MDDLEEAQKTIDFYNDEYVRLRDIIENLRAENKELKAGIITLGRLILGKPRRFTSMKRQWRENLLR